LAGGGAGATRAFSFMATGLCGGTITATLQLKDGTNSLGSVSSTFPLGTALTAFSENFDGVTAPALPAGWTVSWTGVGAAWVTTSALSDSAPNSAFAPEPSDISDNSLISPSFPITTASAQLSFRHNYSTEDTYDGGVLEISIGGGGFTDIIAAGGAFVANGYTKAIDSNYGNPLAGRQAWSGSSGGFITTVVTLPAAAAGQMIQLRWRYGSDNSVSATGWYVDTISVRDGFTCCVGAAAPVILSIARNTNSVSIVWSSTSGLSYRLQYNTNLLTTNWYDVAGDVLAGGATASKTDTNGVSANRFYRVWQLP
jgi:hypothetical protein